MKTSKKGFTLIELLVVIGIIAVIASGIGIALRGGGDRGFALSGAQSTVSSLLTGTRGQAALAQSNAILLVDVSDPAADTFLRQMRIAVQTQPGLWRFVGEPVNLPQGIAVVPKTNPFAGTTFPAGWPSSGPTSLLSSVLVDTTPQTFVDPAGDNHPGQYLRITSFTSRGTVGLQGRLVLSPINRAATGIEFIDQNTVRGMTLSAYGVATLINDATGF